MDKTARTAIAVFAAMCLALALRVIPAWDAVFPSWGISFQEPDAWFHMRAIHNLAAHFPWRSGFDPYMLYASGKAAGANASIAPLWDYVVSGAAWLLGGGSPSEKLVDLTGAWLPALIGAFFPLPVFLFARRLFGDLAGLMSAFWVAVVPGSFLWVSHLGMPDHHAIETLTSFLVLCLISVSVDAQGRRRWWSAGLAGVMLGAYLNIRAAGIFVPAILATAALLQPALAYPVIVALSVACVTFLSSGSAWSGFTWLTLLVGIAVAALSAWLHAVAARRNWPRAFLYAAMGGSLVLAVGGMAIADPWLVHSLALEIQRFLPWHSGTTLVDEVNELRPLWRSEPGGFRALFNMFGGAWILAVPSLAGLLPAQCRKYPERPALTLFLVWSLTMIAGVLFQVRMGAYAGIVVAILAGQSSAWIVERIPAARPSWLRGVAAAILIALGLAATVPFAIAELKPGGGPGPDWWSAMKWLRANSPEPLGDARAWYRFWPELRPPQTFVYPASAYGVLAPWDKGWWITGIAHRIPTANGQQEGSLESARFLMETRPTEALRDLQTTGVRYAALGPEVVSFGFPDLVLESNHRIGQYSRVFHLLRDDGSDTRLRVYLPDFYRSMAARLYLFDGRRETSEGAQVFVTEKARTPQGAERERFLSVQSFASEKLALNWMAEHPSLHTTLASADGTRSCVDTEELPWAARVFASRPDPAAVKIFAFEN